LRELRQFINGNKEAIHPRRQEVDRTLVKELKKLNKERKELLKELKLISKGSVHAVLW
jgi:hypothetical protein